MRRYNSTKRNYMIVGLCAILLIMTVAYSAFSSQLNISGTSSIDSNFLVKITNIEVSNIVGSATDKTDVTTYTDTTATFGTNLVLPGDSITYDITIENQGSIDATLITINKTDTSNSAIIFETSGVTEGDNLLHGESTVMKVTVTYNSAVTSQPNNLSSELKVELNYAQIGTEVVPGVSTTAVFVGGQRVNIVTEGDGLYADEYEGGKYIYKGADPNNYITFNNELWRIISVESDGTIKLLRNELGYRVFDTSGYRDSGSNGAGGTYCANDGYGYGCNAWAATANMVGTPAEFSNDGTTGTVLLDSSLNTYLNGEYLESLSDSNYIVSGTWNIGPVIWYNSDLAAQIASEESYKWNGKVGLITVSEYLKANTNIASCSTFSSNNSNFSTCTTTNWMYDSLYSWWTLSPFAGSSFWVFFLIPDGNVINYTSAYGRSGVRPAIFLSSSISLSGSGEQGDPYKLSL